MIITRADLHLNHVYFYPGPFYIEYAFDATLSFYGTGPTAAGGLSWGRLKRMYR